MKLYVFYTILRWKSKKRLSIHISTWRWCCWVSCHHHVMLLARISLTPSLSPSVFYHLSLLAGLPGYILHPHKAAVLAGRPTFARPCEGVHGRRSLMSSSLLLQQCPACLIRLIWMVFEMGGRWPYICCFVGCCFQDLFNIARSILVQLLSCFFSIRLSASIWCIHKAVWTRPLLGKKLCFILSDRSDFHMIDILSIAVHVFASRLLMSFWN